MKISDPRAALLAATLVFGQAGCRQTAKVDTTAAKVKPGDGPVWTDKELTREDGELAETKAKESLGKTSALSGSWSSEGRDIEKSLGIGRLMPTCAHDATPP